MNRSSSPPWLRLALVLLLLGMAGFAWRPLWAGDDFWAHAAVGRWIWQHHQAPSQTLFLWSAPPQGWIAHSWLSQLAFFGLMSAGGETWGPYLAQGLTLFICGLTWVLLWRLWARHGRLTLSAPLIFAFAIWCASARFHPRPELFSALFLTLLLVFLGDWPRQESRGKWKGWAIVAMFALWANFHGGVALGLVLLWLSAICEYAQQRRQPGRSRLLLIALGATLAIFLNPYGAHYWSALRPVASPMFAAIDEWKPFWAAPAMPMVAAVSVLLLWALGLGAWLWNPQRRWMHGAWLLFLGVMLLGARRHLWSMAQVSIAVMALNAGIFEAGIWWRKLKLPLSPFAGRASRAVTLGLLGGWMLSASPLEAFRPGDALPIRATDPHLPRRAAAVLAAQASPRIWNEYLMSSYLQWRLAGQPPLYIDLLNAYPDDVMANYWEVAEASSHGLQWLARRDANLVILPRGGDRSRTGPLWRFLERSPQWHALYRAEDATIWQRVEHENRTEQRNFSPNSHPGNSRVSLPNVEARTSRSRTGRSQFSNDKSQAKLIRHEKFFTPQEVN